MSKLVFNSTYHAIRFLERSAPDLTRRINRKRHVVVIKRNWTEEENSAFNFLYNQGKTAISPTGYYLLD